MENKDQLSDSDLLAEAKRISEILAKHAAEHDRRGSMPSEGTEALLASPINTALIDGAKWSTFAEMVGILAKGDPSVATAWLMHQGAGVTYKTLADPALVAFFDAEWRRGAWFGNALSEPTSGNLFLMPLQEARRVEGGWQFTGTKRFVTYSERAKFFLTNALCDGAPEFFLIDKDDSITIEDVWDTMGMRGTRSQLVHMNDTLLPDARKLNVDPRAPNALPLGLPFLSIGVAEAALEFAIGYAKERLIPPKNRPLAEMQWVQFAVADMAMQLDAAKALAARAVLLAEAGNPASGLLQMEAKAFANEAAVAITTTALRITGGSGYFRRLPIERYLRDAMSGQIMAWSTEVVRDFVGKMLLGIPPGG
jgi:alkylation response protein AidB-like acyl-CoA dehydrogenase